MKYLKSEDSAYIKTLKNKHFGERCFIIGNGPSLRPEDLDKLKNEYTFAANRIYYIFDRTDWRPSYYICIDNDGLTAEYNRIINSGNYPKFINFKGKRLTHKKADNIWCIFLKGRFTISPCDALPNLSDDISDHASKVGTVTVTSIELAIYMGFKEIFLLGVDNNYAVKLDKNGKQYNDPEVKSSYFEGMRDSNGNIGDGLGYQNVDSMNRSYFLAKKFADEHGVKIYNATRGGKLEIFNRVDLDMIVK